MALTFHDGSTAPVVWHFARDLLTDVLTTGRSGVGDVSCVANTPTVTIALRGAGGRRHVFVMRRSDISYFLDRTASLVPVGSEEKHINWDAELSAILGPRDGDSTR